MLAAWKIPPQTKYQFIFKISNTEKLTCRVFLNRFYRSIKELKEETHDKRSKNVNIILQITGKTFSFKIVKKKTPNVDHVSDLKTITGIEHFCDKYFIAMRRLLAASHFCQSGN